MEAAQREIERRRQLVGDRMVNDFTLGRTVATPAIDGITGIEPSGGHAAGAVRYTQEVAVASPWSGAQGVDQECGLRHRLEGDAVKDRDGREDRRPGGRRREESLRARNADAAGPRAGILPDRGAVRGDHDP